MDREDFFRLKKVQGKKKEKAAAADVVARAKLAEEDEAAREARERRKAEADNEVGGREDVLGGKDEDVIF
jgi:V-type H+-transporting ATPase subunit D